MKSDHAAAVFIIVILALLFFAIGVAIDSALVALVWNGLGLHNVFNAGKLSFWQCVGVGFILTFLFGGTGKAAS